MEPPKEGPTLAQRLRASPITVALLMINAVVFLVAESKGNTTETATLIRFGAVEPLHVWSGEYWRLASYMFLHIGWVHFLWNTAMGFSMCTMLERALGRWRFLAVYLVSGIAGGAASTLALGPTSAGASGALFGVIGAILALRRRQLPSWSAAWKDPPTRSTLVQIAIWTVIGMTVLSFNNKAHFGGMIAGALMAWIMTERRPAARVWEWAAFAAGFAALLVFATRPWMLGNTTRAPDPFADYDESNPIFQRCRSGEAVACHTLALRESDPPVDLFHALCATGDRDACGAEGWAIANGKGAPKDAARGAELMAGACTNGSAWSCGLAKGAPLE